MNEEAVYSAAKTWLRLKGWDVIGGQPPSGTDHLPVIEIKNDAVHEKGSRGAYKPDLVALKDATIAFIECKPKYDFDDHHKLESILGSHRRLRSAWNEIRRRNIEAEGLVLAFEDMRFVGILAHDALHTISQQEVVGLLRCSAGNPLDVELVPAEAWAKISNGP